MNLINNSIVFDKNVMNLFSYLHICMHWEEFYRHRFLQTYFLTDFQIEYRIFLWGTWFENTKSAWSSWFTYTNHRVGRISRYKTKFLTFSPNIQKFHIRLFCRVGYEDIVYCSEISIFIISIYFFQWFSYIWKEP